MGQYVTVVSKVKQYDVEVAFNKEVDYSDVSKDKLHLALKDGLSFSFDGTKIDARNGHGEVDLVYMARMLFAEHTMYEFARGFHNKIVGSDIQSLIRRMKNEDRQVLSESAGIDSLESVVDIEKYVLNKSSISKYINSEWDLLGHDAVVPYITVHAFLKTLGFYDLKEIKKSPQTSVFLNKNLEEIRKLLKERFNDPEKINLITEVYKDVVTKIAKLKEDGLSLKSIARLNFFEGEALQDSLIAYLIIKKFGKGKPIEQIIESYDANKETRERIVFNYNRIIEVLEPFYDRLRARIAGEKRHNAIFVEELVHPYENILLIGKPELELSSTAYLREKDAKEQRLKMPEQKKKIFEAFQDIRKNCFVLNPKDLLSELEAIAGKKLKFYGRELFPKIESEKDKFPKLYEMIQRIRKDMFEKFKYDFEKEKEELTRESIKRGESKEQLRNEIKKKKLEQFEKHRAEFYENIKPEFTEIAKEIINEIRGGDSFFDNDYLFRSIRGVRNIFLGLDEFLEHFYSSAGLDPEADMLLAVRLTNTFDKETARLCAEFYHNDNVIDQREKDELTLRVNNRENGSRINMMQLNKMMLHAYYTNPHHMSLSDEIIRYFLEIREDKLYSLHEQMSVEELREVQEEIGIVNPHLFKFLYFLLQHNIAMEKVPSKNISDFVSLFKVVLHEGLNNPYYDSDTNKLLREMMDIYARARSNNTETASGELEYKLIERIILDEFKRWEEEAEKQQGREITNLIFKYRTPDMGCPGREGGAIGDCRTISNYFGFFEEAYLLGEVGLRGKMLSFAEFMRFNKARMALDKLDTEIFRKYCAEKILSQPCDGRPIVEIIVDVAQKMDKKKSPDMVKPHIPEKYSSIAKDMFEPAYHIHLYETICQVLEEKKDEFEKREIEIEDGEDEKDAAFAEFGLDEDSSESS
ncbi:hypothetical protein KY339_05645 [Candidatus Woesearchaeota archaeon]|nr:hypothetical protein [Candidatus Woesearchaeota archaeon]